MITKYKAIDRYRQYEKRATREQTEKLPQQQTAYTTEQTILAYEQKNELLFALSQLAELDRHIFIMKYFLELSNSEIAESLGITKAAVDNRLYRGKKELAQNRILKERLI
jgi:RNA polymerase sigma factor (sigma-70 family)